MLALFLISSNGRSIDVGGQFAAFTGFRGETAGQVTRAWQSCTAAWGACDKGNVLERIIKSLTPVALLVAGAVVFVLGTAFLLASDATLPSSAGASGDLAQAGHWLQFLGGLSLLGAACTAGWEVIVASNWAAAAEVAAAALGTLLFMVGLAALAASDGSSPAAAVTEAVGVGVWALLVLSRAARTSLAEQGPRSAVPGGRRRQADLWLAAAIGLFALAIGYGFTSAGSTGPQVAAGVLQAAGTGALAGSVATARSRQLLGSRPVPVVVAGLALLAVSFLAYAIVAGLAFGTLTALGAGLAVVTAVELAAIVALGLAAWTRLRELYK
jgi:hypothetical protein